jgi:hypothetical protein
MNTNLNSKELSMLEKVVYGKDYFHGCLTCNHPEIKSGEKGVWLMHPLLYSISARAEYQLLTYADTVGEQAISYFNIKPTSWGQGGVEINWEKMSTLFYIPRFIRESMRIPDSGRTHDIFSQDEGQAGAINDYHQIIDCTHPNLVKAVLNIIPEEKVKKIAEDVAWRRKAKSFTRIVIRKCRGSIDSPLLVAQDYHLTPIVKKLLDIYIKQMK